MGNDGKDCKWYENDFCVNADCPICADWCPFNSVEAQAAVCRFYEPKGEA